MRCCFTPVWLSGTIRGGDTSTLGVVMLDLAVGVLLSPRSALSCSRIRDAVTRQHTDQQRTVAVTVITPFLVRLIYRLLAHFASTDCRFRTRCNVTPRPIFGIRGSFLAISLSPMCRNVFDGDRYCHSCHKPHRLLSITGALRTFRRLTAIAGLYNHVYIAAYLSISTRCDLPLVLFVTLGGGVVWMKLLLRLLRFFWNTVLLRGA